MIDLILENHQELFYNIYAILLISYIARIQNLLIFLAHISLYDQK